MKLIEINESGTRPATIRPNAALEPVIEAMLGLYRREGFVRPWTGYIAVADATPLGTCGFKSPPVEGRVEIAYFTFPENEGNGIGTAMARELVRIAKGEDQSLTVIAQTLPKESASTGILKKVGFRRTGSVEHPEDGTVWEWEFR